MKFLIGRLIRLLNSLDIFYKIKSSDIVLFEGCGVSDEPENRGVLAFRHTDGYVKCVQILDHLYYI